MHMKKNRIYIGMAWAMLALASCSSDPDVADMPLTAQTTPLTVDVRYPSTRATESAFEEGDKIGLYMADAEAPLDLSGNLVNNEMFTLKGGTWASARPLYWDAGTFHAYAYYPYMPIESIEDQPFSVAADQTAAGTSATLSGYEASDLLYAKTAGVTASSSPVILQFRHIMSRLTIRLVKGEDFEGDMPTDARVFIHNTVPTATVDLSAGIATRQTKGTVRTIEALQTASYRFAAIIVPQRIASRVPLVEVVMKGVSYLFESKFLFKPGVNHLVNLVITDNPEQVKIEVGGEVENWQ